MFMSQILTGWRNLDRVSKTILSIVALLQIPVLYLIFNNITCGFSPDRAVYEHLSQIARVYDGNPIYSPMAFDFCPITYTPLYWLVCGWVWKLIGPGFLSPQVVSLLASMMLFFFVARFLWKGTSRDLFLTAMGLFNLLLISFFTGFWLFQTSVDALHFALTVAGFYCLRKTEGKALVWAAVWLSLGALTKQTGLAYVAAGGLYVLLKAPKKIVFYAGAALLVCGGGLAILQIGSGGQFYDIVVRENQGPLWDSARLMSEVWGSQFLGQLVLLLLFSLWPILSSKTWAEAWRRILTPEYTMAAAGIAVACIAQPKFGSGNNHAVIAMTGLLICGWQGVHVLMNQLQETGVGAKFRGGIVVLQTVVFLIPAWQQVSMRVIDKFDRQQYAQIEGVFKRGNTMLYHFPYIARSFGYPSGGHAGNEKCRWIDGQWSYANKPDFLSAPYREQRFDYVILGASIIDKGDPTIQAIMENYSVAMNLPPHPTRPNTLMLRYPVYVLKANRLVSRQGIR